jgi:hypothetical protein
VLEQARSSSDLDPRALAREVFLIQADAETVQLIEYIPDDLPFQEDLPMNGNSCVAFQIDFAQPGFSQNVA